MNAEGQRGGGQLRSAIAVAAIDEVRSDRDRIMDLHFSPEEVVEVKGRHPRTTAGFLAVKEALCALYRDVVPAGRCEATDFTLSHDEQGRPVLVGAPGPIGAPRSTWISIAHTRELAYGLAVFHERGRG